MSTRFDLDDKEWALIEPLLPTGLRGARRTDDRRVMNGIFYVLRAGWPLRMNLSWIYLYFMRLVFCCSTAQFTHTHSG